MLADECTKKQTRIPYARVLIDMDVIQELPSEIDIIELSSKLFSEKAEYDWKTLFCRECILDMFVEETLEGAVLTLLKLIRSLRSKQCVIKVLREVRN